MHNLILTCVDSGVRYRPVPDLLSDDPLIDGRQCALDFPVMKSMGLNTIFVSLTDLSLGHDRCMKALADNGLYLLLVLTDAHSNPVCLA